MALSDYLSMITSQHKNKPKFKAMLTLLYNMVSTIDILNEFPTLFSIDTAVGNQLDILGEILGLSRKLPFTPSDGSDPNMGDTVYRIALKAKIIFNAWDGQMSTLVTAWKRLFPDNPMMILDNQDMSMSVIIMDNTQLIYKDLLENNLLIPHPMGVKLNYCYGTSPVFGYDLETDYIAGYDVGTWVYYASPSVFVYGNPGANQGGYGTGHWS